MAVNISTIKRSIEHYGAEKEAVVCMEELAELIQAISKELRGESDMFHLTEEIADVEICIEMIKQIFNISEKTVNDWIWDKQQRQIKRIEKESNHEM